MAEAESRIWGLNFACARARARFVVAGMRLSRMRAFLPAVQRPTMLSPARWMTASKPETKSGKIGRAGSQRTRSSSPAPRTVPARASLAIRAPAPFSAGINADPMRPEEPLTRMRAIERFPTNFNVADALGRWRLFRFYESAEFRDRKSAVGRFERTGFRLLARCFRAILLQAFWINKRISDSPNPRCHAKLFQGFGSPPAPYPLRGLIHAHGNPQ